MTISGADKIAKLIRMLNSDQTGEVNAAVQALRRTLASNNLTLNDLADAIEKNGNAKFDGYPDIDDNEAVAKWCYEHVHLIKRHFDRSFIERLIRDDTTDNWRLTIKQRQWLQSIFKKICGL